MINLTHLFLTAWKAQVATVIVTYVTTTGALIELAKHLPHIPMSGT